MEYLFQIVYRFLKFLEKISGFSYEEINIIIWFILIPLSWMFLLDKIMQKHYFKAVAIIILIFAVLYIDDFEHFSKITFNTAVQFLNTFNAIGSTYKASSVVICIFIPVLIYWILISKTLAVIKTKRLSNTNK